MEEAKSKKQKLKVRDQLFLAADLFNHSSGSSSSSDVSDSSSEQRCSKRNTEKKSWKGEIINETSFYKTITEVKCKNSWQFEYCKRANWTCNTLRGVLWYLSPTNWSQGGSSHCLRSRRFRMYKKHNSQELCRKEETETSWPTEEPHWVSSLWWSIQS